MQIKRDLKLLRSLFAFNIFLKTIISHSITSPNTPLYPFQLAPNARKDNCKKT
jgi:hypothetical protein